MIELYGPTEAVIVSTRYRADGGTVEDVAHCIGRPFADTRVYILDAQMQPAPVGVAGELYIGGAQRRPRVLEPGRADGGAVRRQPVRRGRPAVQDGRSRALSARRQHRVPGPQRLPGEDPRLPHRAGRDRGASSPRIPACARRWSSRSTTRAARSGWSRTTRADAAAEIDRRSAARASARAAAGVHGARRVRAAGDAAAHRQRQARPQGAARAGRRCVRLRANTKRPRARSKERWRRSGASCSRWSASGATTTSSSSAATRCWRCACSRACARRCRSRSA